ncbi:Rid family hydrolase, partial [Vibrio anguillarum]|uniref:Rid family hydrolase n=1 Tax=Vibrio anguillarum TaxID=55601 RepID=UPI002285CC39
SIPLYVNDEPITDIQRLSQFHYTNGNPLMTRITMVFESHQASFPARSCVEVARLPMDAKVEIEVIATK